MFKVVYRIINNTELFTWGKRKCCKGGGDLTLSCFINHYNGIILIKLSVLLIIEYFRDKLILLAMLTGSDYTEGIFLSLISLSV